MALLEVDGIHVFYDKIEALKGISLAVEERQIVTLVGGNGAGKSTTLRAISGLLHPRQGEIRFDGRPLAGLGAHEIAAIGVVHVPEGRRIFGRLTVSENLEMGAFTRRDRRAIADDKEQMLVLFPRLRERLKQVAGTLSGGEQQMLAAARALMATATRAADGRAEHGAGTYAGRAGVRDDRADQRAGRDDTAGGAERADGAGHCPSWLRAGERADRAGWPGARAAGR